MFAKYEYSGSLGNDMLNLDDLIAEDETEYARGNVIEEAKAILIHYGYDPTEVPTNVSETEFRNWLRNYF